MPLPLTPFEVAELPRPRPAIRRIAIDALVITVSVVVAIILIVAFGGSHG